MYHHIYTSISGYKTVYAPELSPSVIRILEAFSSTLYPRVKQVPLRSLFHPSPEHICISRIFRSSADHAGRKRSCVHNILFSKQELFDLRYVNPCAFPDSLFIKTAPDMPQVPSLHRKLPSKLDLGSPSAADLEINLDALNSPMAQTIFSAATSRHDMAVVAPSFDCYGFMAAAGDMLPPFLRLSTSLISGGVYRSPHTEGAAIFALSPGHDTTVLSSEGVITYDITSGRTANLPAPNRYFSFIAFGPGVDLGGALHDRPSVALGAGRDGAVPGGPKELVRKLVAIVHRYPLARLATNDMYYNLIKAFRETSHCFSDDGSLNAMSDIKALLKNLITYYRAGYSEIVLDALRQAFSDMEVRGELSGSADILKQLETSLADQVVQPVQKEAAISRLAGWLGRAYASA